MIIHKNTLVHRDDYNESKYMAKSGSTVVQGDGAVVGEMEYASKGHTNVVAAIQRHYSSK